MRIIGGTLGGRRFYPPAKNWPTRPTTDISKEALFNILQNELDFEDLRVLDIFGGTGNHSFEFASRGCTDITYVDKFNGCVRFVSQQAKEWKVDEQIQIVKKDVYKFIKLWKQEPYDYIFAGPPYPLKWLDEIPKMVLEAGMLAEDGLFVLEHNPEHNFESDARFERSRHYGQTIFSFFR